MGPIRHDYVQTGVGYGHAHWGGRDISAHRLAFAFTFGPLAPGTHVLHTCDNPPCCNPAHLSAGTNADNIADRAAKGRNVLLSQPGESNGRCRLTDDQITVIRQRCGVPGVRRSPIAREFGISRSYLNRLVRGDRRPAPRPGVPDLALQRGMGAAAGEPRRGRRTEAPVGQPTASRPARALVTVPATHSPLGGRRTPSPY